MIDTPNRLSLLIEGIVPPGKTDKEAIEWMQKVLDFYFPTMEAKVIIQTQSVAPVVPAEPKSSLVSDAPKPRRTKRD